ncbi:MAG: DUF2378 family protein [Deltaproteobacteria bacterium]|nr:DUF2378 family protein [Deltaproteobacteria bacterium]
MTALDPDVPLEGGFDPEARFARFPRSFTLKGLFFAERVAQLGPRWETEVPGLLSPPRLGRYLPFGDYPQVDYSRLTYAACTKLHPELSLREAARRVARADLATFARSTLGRVMLSMVGDLGDVLLAFPAMHRRVLHGGSVSAERLGPSRVRLQYREFYGWLDCYAVGTAEGIVLHQGHRPRITLDLQEPDRGSLDVCWE